MKTHHFLPLLLSLGLVAGCNKSDATAAAGDVTKSLGDAAKGLSEQAQTAMDGLKSLDLSKLPSMDPAALKQMATDAMGTITTQLGSIKDVASAEKVKALIEPLLGNLDGVKKALGGSLPNMESVKGAISALKAKFPTGDVMNVIKPIIEKLTGLVG